MSTLQYLRKKFCESRVIRNRVRFCCFEVFSRYILDLEHNRGVISTYRTVKRLPTDSHMIIDFCLITREHEISHDLILRLLTPRDPTFLRVWNIQKCLQPLLDPPLTVFVFVVHSHLHVQSIPLPSLQRSRTQSECPGPTFQPRTFIIQKCKKRSPIP